MFDALKERKNGYIVFVMNSPILHIACIDIESAKKMLELALHSGLKASSIKSVSDKRVIVEILTTYKVDAPIGEDGKLFVDDSYLRFLLDYSNLKLKKAREILMRWANKLDELINPQQKD
jgi:tRNA wybutosine-synthesizing protein 3